MYIGEKRIGSTECSEDGIETIVIFEDGSKVTMPTKVYDCSVATEEEDATKLQTRHILAVQKELMELLLSWNMKLRDIEPLFYSSTIFLKEKAEGANDKLWGNHFEDRTIRDLNRVLTSDGVSKSES